PQRYTSAHRLMMNAHVTVAETRNTPARLITDERGCIPNLAIDSDHILHQPQSALIVKCQQRLGMELHSLNGKSAMPDTHDYTVFGFRGHFQAVRQHRSLCEERVITPYLKAFRQSLKNAFTLMNHGGRLAVHRVIQHPQLASER